MTEDNNPYRPHILETEEILVKGAEPKSHWFIRLMAMFVGSMMVGMTLALAWQTANWFLSALGLAMLGIGAMLIRAGIKDRPPNLSFLRPTANSRPRRRF
jgi:hypothetical protein